MQRFNWTKRELYLGGTVVVLLILLVMSYVHPLSQKSSARSLSWDQTAVPQDTKKTHTKETKSLDGSKPRTIVVDVKGAVASPGVYTLKKEDRVLQAIHKAGGFLKKADKTQINLAQHVQDEMVVNVPKKGEMVKNTFGPASTDAQDRQKKVAINLADEKELETLPGIGPSKAQAIISYRKKHGPFKKISDLLNVSGIGDKMLERLKDLIQL